VTSKPPAIAPASVRPKHLGPTERADHDERLEAVARAFDDLPDEWREHFEREAAAKLPPP